MHAYNRIHKLLVNQITLNTYLDQLIKQCFVLYIFLEKNKKNFFSGQDILKPRVVNIDLSNPIHINMEPDLENMSAQTYYTHQHHEFYNYS